MKKVTSEDYSVERLFDLYKEERRDGAVQRH